MDIDAILATASPEEASVPQAAEASATETPKEAPKVEEDLSTKLDSELTPEQLAKRQSNRESKLNSKLAEMKRQNRELQAQLGQKQPQSNQPTPPSATKTDLEPPLRNEYDTQADFEKDLEKFKKGVPISKHYDSWDDYTSALMENQLEQKLSAKDKQVQQTQQNQEFDKWKGERAQHIDKRVEELSSTIPDFESSLEEIEESMPAITPEMGMVILQADDINLAAYALKKEGGVEAVLKVLQMPPLKAAAEIAKAEVRGQAYLQQKPTTGAPTPLTPARGNTVGGTSIEKMDGVQLLRSLRKKG